MAVMAAADHDQSERRPTDAEIDESLTEEYQRRLSTLNFVGVVGWETAGAVPPIPPFGGPAVPDALVYSDYGCWCGTNSFWRGPCNGGKIVDATDRCCFNHDTDWANAPLPANGGAGCNCKTQNYRWGKAAGNAAVCAPGQNQCASYCCSVDVKMGKCLRAASATQNNALWDFSDRTVPGCKPCDYQLVEVPPPGDGVTCDEKPCCSDCVCCGPGTIWTGEKCALMGSSPEDPCSDYQGPEKCVIPKCREAECCDSGTQFLEDPILANCLCYPQGLEA